MSRVLPSQVALAKRLVIFSCFFVSGATSLALETAWSKQLSYILGVDLFGTATTVVAYMTGLGLGAYLAERFAQLWLPRPLVCYALLQVGIGLIGMASIPMLVGTTPLFSLLYHLNQSQAPFLLLRFLVTLGLLLPATTLMGMTLPMVVSAGGRLGTAGVRVAALLYGLNTLGAVVGTTLAGLVLIPRLGLSRTCLVAGGIDLAIACIIGLIFVRSTTSHLSVSVDVQRTSRASAGGWRRAFPVYCAVALSGAAGLGLELSWFRLLVQVQGPTVTALAVTLAVFLTGIGLGSASMGWLMRWFRSGESALAASLAWTAVGAIAPMFFVDRIPAWYLELWRAWGRAGRDIDLLLVQLTTAACIILPATLGLGASFPAGIWAYQKSAHTDDSAAASSGESPFAAARLFYVNTIGSVVGALVWAFGVLPGAGAVAGIKAAAAMAAAGIGVTLGMRFIQLRVTWRSYLLLATLVACIISVPRPNPLILNSGPFSSVRSREAESKVDIKPLRKEATLLFAKEGYNTSVAVIKNRHGRDSIDIAYSGKWEASTHPSSIRHLVLLGQLPMMLAKTAPERVLVIGLGAGITSGSVLRHSSVRRLDIVELEPAIIEGSAFFNSFSGDPTHDARTQLMLQDGRTHVVFGRQAYDVITSDPVHPWVKGASNLYTQEFYRGAHERLGEAGVFCQWIPSSMTTDSFKTIAKTMRSVFADVKVMFSEGEGIAVASDRPIVIERERLAQVLNDDEVRADLEKYHLSDLDELVEFLQRHLRVVPPPEELHVPVNTDDNVLLEHALPWEMFHGARAVEAAFPLAIPRRPKRRQ
jgi:spermidine synthase